MKENKKKKVLIWIGVIIIGIIILDFFVIKAVRRNWDCEEDCKFIPSGEYWRYRSEYTGTKVFETQDQCIDYCFRKHKEETGWVHFLWIKGLLKGFSKGLSGE